LDAKTLWNYSPTRPVGIFSLALNYHFNQLNVRNYHLVNLTIHLINACLVFWLTLLIFSSPALKNDQLIKHKKAIAFFMALLFVSHPLATQSVTYIVQRYSSMVAMFYLLSLILYVKARLSNRGNISKILLFTGSLISALLAMLTKENAFTLPFAILLFELFFLQTMKLSINFRDYRVILLIIAFLGMIIFIPSKYSFGIFKPIPPSNGHAYTITSVNYLFTQFSVIVKYIQLLFLPVNQILDYDFPISNTFFEIRTLLSFLLLLSLVILGIFSFKRYRIISFGIFWFFLTLSVESGFIPINDVIFEHRTYLPSFGFFLILASGIYLLLWNKNKYFAISIFVIIIGSNSWLTWERNKVWKDEFSLWNDNIANAPDLPRPFFIRGFAYGNLGQWDKSIADYSRAIRIYPEYTDAYYNRGNAYASIGQVNKAIDDYSRAISLNSDYKEALCNRGNAYEDLGQWDKAIADYTRAIAIDPKFPMTWYNRGIACGKLEQWDKAIADYSKAIGNDPRYTDAYYNRGVVYYHLKQWENAIADFSRAIAIDPDHLKAYSERAVAYANLGQWEKAISDYSTAIGLNPDNSNTYYDRGIAYANLGQWEKAIADYSKALEIDPKNAYAQYNREIALKKRVTKSQSHKVTE
jgi:tetratricopeptide (TPR) repeat protein/uncharacterized membrane protein YwzB